MRANSLGVYVIVNPYTGNQVAEVISARWDKINAMSNVALPISNASQANIDVRNQAAKIGATVIEIDHSRGSLISYIATAEQVNQGVTNTPISSVTFNGAAANAQNAANLLQTATQNAPGGPGTQFQATHVDDLIGTVIGGNPSTGGEPGVGVSSHSSYRGAQQLNPEDPADAKTIQEDMYFWGEVVLTQGL